MTVEAGPFYLRSILLHDLSLSRLTLHCIALHLDPLVLLVLSAPTPANANSAAKKATPPLAFWFPCRLYRLSSIIFRLFTRHFHFHLTNSYCLIACHHVDPLVLPSISSLRFHRQPAVVCLAPAV